MKFLLYPWLVGHQVLSSAVIGVGVHGGSFLLSDLAKVDFGAIAANYLSDSSSPSRSRPRWSRCTWLPGYRRTGHCGGAFSLLVGLLDKIGTLEC